MRTKDDLSFEYVSSILAYAPDTGVLTWKVRQGKAQAGQVAGVFEVKNGYRVITIRRSIYKAHRLAWLLHYGSWPVGQIDHVNRIPADNRIVNLRIATSAENAHNRRHLHDGRVVGVERNGSRWRASIKVDGRKRHLGMFPSREDAATAYRLAAIAVYGNFATRPT